MMSLFCEEWKQEKLPNVVLRENFIHQIEPNKQQNIKSIDEAFDELLRSAK